MNKSDSEQIEHRVRQAVETCFPGLTTPFFILGVSGGPDSMCLMYLFHKLDIRALVVHINYGKRGRESDMDAELVEQMAFQWGFDCQSLAVQPAEGRGNFQQWARALRYDMFRSLAIEHEAAGLAVAHHQEDQVETILQKQFRGAGLASWSGMSRWDGEIFRPLLTTTRQEIDEYIQENGIPFRTDRSNLESDFARNFLRNEWLGRLEQYFPGWRHNILRLADQARLFEESVHAVTAAMKDERGRIHLDGLLELSPGLRRAVILEEAKKAEPGVTVSRDALKELDKLEDLQTGRSIGLSDTLSLLRDRKTVVLQRKESGSAQPALRVFVTLEKDKLKPEPFEQDGLLYEITTYEQPDYHRALYLDVEKMNWPLCLRRWEDGDRFRPFGMGGRQKVSDHLTNRKISSEARSRALVLASPEGDVYAVLFPPGENIQPPGTIAEPARCGETTRQCLIVRMF